jgi:hypothetical protein
MAGLPFERFEFLNHFLPAIRRRFPLEADGFQFTNPLLGKFALAKKLPLSGYPVRKFFGFSLPKRGSSGIIR